MKTFDAQIRIDVTVRSVAEVQRLVDTLTELAAGWKALEPDEPPNDIQPTETLTTLFGRPLLPIDPDDLPDDDDEPSYEGLRPKA